MELARPFRGAGVVIIASGAVGYALVRNLHRVPYVGDLLAMLLQLAGLFALGAVAHDAVVRSAAGEPRGPSFPDLSDVLDGVLRPGWLSLAAGAVALAPAHVYRHLAGGDSKIAFLGLGAAGLLYVPGALAGTVRAGGVAGRDPRGVLGAAVRRPVAAGAAWGLFVASLAVVELRPVAGWPGGSLLEGAILVFLVMAGAGSAGATRRDAAEPVSPGSARRS